MGEETMKRYEPVIFLRMIAVALAVAVFAAVGVSIAADTYPSKPIRLIVPFAAGGLGDLTARTVAQKMGENMGQRFVIDNRPSAGMAVSAEMALNAPADGYTILHGGSGTAVSATLFKSLPYNILTDFVQVSLMASTDLLLIVNSESKYASLGEMIAYGKSNPGKLNFGTVSVGSTQHLAAELFKRVAGVNAVIVTYKGTPEALVALRSGEVDLVFDYASGALPQIQSKSIRILAIAAPRRDTDMPDIPTTGEAGVPGFHVESWNAVSVRTGTPRPIIDRLNREMVTALSSTEVKQKLAALGLRPKSATPEQTREFMISEIARWKSVIESANIPRN
jgi:tripartite-type tricarboxylate transporter receptor subunit TctC